LSRLDALIFDIAPKQADVESPSGIQAAACDALTAAITRS
jgi:hypothetical protein